MGTSFVNHREVGFWANDAAIDIWLRMLVREIDSRSPGPAWLAELREHWQEQARFGGSGSLNFALDEFITSDARKQIALSVADGALARLARYGGIITWDQLNALTEDTPGVSWARDVPVDSFEAVGNAFIGLLKGEITTNAATAQVIR